VEINLHFVREHVANGDVQVISIPTITIGNWLFAECSTLCRVFFVGHSAKTSLPSAALSKVSLSVTIAFAESGTLGTGRHSVQFGTRQRTVNSRLKLTTVIYAERQALALDKEATLPSALRLTLGK
jgi:hypothetical protein